jgi:hypothetical protein
MKFKASIEQIKKICANAVNHSSPAGAGYLKWVPDHEFTPEEFNDRLQKGDFVHLDYVEGRMVKLYMERVEGDIWETRDEDPDIEYQSWCSMYYTYIDLVTSVSGVIIMEHRSIKNEHDTN